MAQKHTFLDSLGIRENQTNPNELSNEDEPKFYRRQEPRNMETL